MKITLLVTIYAIMTVSLVVILDWDVTKLILDVHISVLSFR